MSDPRCTMRLPVEVGLLARSTFTDLVAFGRWLGLDVQVEHGGGWLSRIEYVTSVGPLSVQRRWLAAIRREAG